MIGTICLTTEQGLGYLAKSFFDNGLIDNVLIKEHSSRTNHREWYPKEAIMSSEDELLEKSNILIFFEEVFNWKIILKAREKGIKTILIPMYECTRYPFPYEPDEIWCPSELDYKFYKEKGQENIKLIQIPVDVKWNKRSIAKTFVFNNGNGGLGGRNGLKELIDALEWIKSPIKLIIRSQVPITLPEDPRIDLRIGTFDDIWSEGDVFIFPEKFNGLSLPLQEAFASGMLVIATNRFPNYSYLPIEPLIPVSGYKKERISVEFESAIIEPKEIAKCIDTWYNKNIEKFSLLGLEYNKKNQWKKQKEILKMLM